MRSVPNVDKNVKFLSNLILAGQSTVEIVGQRKDPQEEIDTKLTS
jgi:hypothetical protein